MSVIRVPEAGVRGMIELAAWSEPQYTEFLGKLQSLPVEAPMQPALMTAAKESTNANTDTVLALVSMVRSVITTRKSFSGNDEEYVGELLDSASAQRERGEHLTDPQVKILRGRLLPLLGLRKLALSAKATKLLFDREKIVSDFLVITDIRPVFDPEQPELFDSALIIHSLKIEYDCDAGSKDIFLALDESDLTKLIDVARRALDKGKALREKFVSSGIDMVKIRGGE